MTQIISASYYSNNFETNIKLLRGFYYSTGSLRLPGYGGIDLFLAGTFSRSTSGSYYNGSISSLAWSNPNVRRIENRGDFDGILLEGSRTNLFSSYNGSAVNLISFTGSLPGVDGTNQATRFTIGSGGYSSYWFGSMTSFPCVGTVFQKIASSNTTIEQTYYDGVTVTYTGSATELSSAWIRKAVRSNKLSGGAANGSYVPVDARGYAISAGDRDAIIDLPQVEPGAFASSPIRTSGSSATRGADILTISTGSYPISICTRGFILEYAPICSYQEMIDSGAGHSLITFGNNGGGFHISFTGGSGSLVAEKTLSSYTTVVSGVTFSANQKLTIMVEPSLGRVTLFGATTGNGTFTTSGWSFPTQSLNIGTTYGGAGSPAFGRFGRWIIPV